MVDEHSARARWLVPEDATDLLAQARAWAAANGWGERRRESPASGP
jgi:hypothetical protein